MINSAKKLPIYITISFVFIILSALAYVQLSSWFRITYKMDEPFSMIGVAEVCTPYRDKTPGWHTASCHGWILGLDGKYYIMTTENIDPLCHITTSNGFFVFEGILRPLPMLEKAYDAVAVIEINKMRRLTGIRTTAELKGQCP